MATKKLKQLTDWDWTTLVAAWRYYQYRSTIVSATFPRDIYERYFMGEYSPDTLRESGLRCIRSHITSDYAKS